MILVNMHPTEWDLPKQDKEELMALLGLSAGEWERKTREHSKRLANTEQTRLRVFGSPAGEFGPTQPQTSPFGGLVAALS